MFEPIRKKSCEHGKGGAFPSSEACQKSDTTAHVSFLSPVKIRGVVSLESNSAIKERTIDHEMISDSL